MNRLAQAVAVLACSAIVLQAMWAPVAPKIMLALEALHHAGLVR